MGSYYSILSNQNNPLSDESLAIGLLIICNEKVFFKVSKRKIDFAKKLNPKSARLLEFSFNRLREFIEVDSIDQTNQLIKFNKKFDIEYLSRLSNYNNNILRFSKPQFISGNVDALVFEDYFNRFIGIEDEVHYVIQSKEIAQTELNHNVETKLYNPLRNLVDVDYTIKSQRLPSLFFDIHFDAIGINGALYAAKSDDLNTNKSIPNLKAEISEYESAIERLNLFAEMKKINGDHKYFLITDPYTGNSNSIKQIYSILSNQRMPFFEVLKSNEIDKITSLIIKRNAKKISPELNTISS